jgi:hypothetical protein
MLQGLPGGDLGICNIYAPNNPCEHCQLWEALIEVLPATCHWILAGNFNMVLSRQDKKNPCGRLFPQYEHVIFIQLLGHLGLDDNPRSIGSFKYSWDNLKEDGVQVLAQLDRAYIFCNDSVQGGQKLVTYSIQADTGWSNHYLLEIVTELGEGQYRQSRFKMSSL